jgi:hypothetical protein
MDQRQGILTDKILIGLRDMSIYIRQINIGDCIKAAPYKMILSGHYAVSFMKISDFDESSRNDIPSKQ